MAATAQVLDLDGVTVAVTRRSVRRATLRVH
ncbi:MAG: hypothetical protein RLZZ272_1751, partial [Actinomycetota bacterium]